MSFPNIPSVNPAIDIDREDVISILLASIAFEELGLAHIINAEAEKIQYVLGTLKNEHDDSLVNYLNYEQPTIKELLEVNKSVNKTLQAVIKNQMLLQFKLEDVLELDKEKPYPKEKECI